MQALDWLEEAYEIFAERAGWRHLPPETSRQLTAKAAEIRCILDDAWNSAEINKANATDA